jgi:DnaJ-class molecular chaperone
VNVRSGEVIFKLETLHHPVFERVGNDLKTTVRISLKQALLGFEKELTHLDGRSVSLSRVGKITNPGMVERLPGEGMPVYERASEKGDLIITYQVELPKTLTAEQKDQFRRVF